MKDNTMIIALGGKIPQIGQNVFIAPTAVIVGDVQIEDGASIWYGAVLRGDMARIRVGEFPSRMISVTFTRPSPTGR